MDQIGPYKILGELGEGGMGKVYRAMQPSVKRVVALKVLPAHFESNETMVRRFKQEAESAANLSHPHIVKVWDAAVDQPPYYIAMEVLEGGNLSSRLALGTFSVEDALGIIYPLCTALDYSHSYGVIHRDIKPDNIMFDTNGRPVLTDFGIAKAVEQTAMTVAGAKFGTPDYMSPEQAKGLKVDNRSDLYSLTVVFFEMITGRTPFCNEEPLVTMRQIIDEPIPSPRLFNPAIPSGLEAAILKALAKSPSQRYQNGAELSQALWLGASQTPKKRGRSVPPEATTTTPAPPTSKAVKTSYSPSQASAVQIKPVEVLPKAGLSRQATIIILLSVIVLGIGGIMVYYFISTGDQYIGGAPVASGPSLNTTVEPVIETIPSPVPTPKKPIVKTNSNLTPGATDQKKTTTSTKKTGQSTATTTTSTATASSTDKTKPATNNETALVPTATSAPAPEQKAEPKAEPKPEPKTEPKSEPTVAATPAPTSTTTTTEPPPKTTPPPKPKKKKVNSPW